MINNVSQIASPYSKTAAKVNDTSTLDATEWNNISAAVETAHQKINQILSDGSGTMEIEAYNPIEIQSNNNGGENGDVGIHADNDIIIQALNDITISGENEIMFVLGNDSVSLADIITIVNYFKTNNSTGPFASAA